MTFAMLCFNYTVGIPCAATVLTWLFVLWRGRFFTAQAKQPHPPTRVRTCQPSTDAHTLRKEHARQPTTGKPPAPGQAQSLTPDSARHSFPAGQPHKRASPPSAYRVSNKQRKGRPNSGNRQYSPSGRISASPRDSKPRPLERVKI